MKLVEPEVIKDLLSFLVEKKLDNNISSYISIKNALYSFSIPISKVAINQGIPLFRMRVHDEIHTNLEEALFHEIKDVGHRLDYNNIKNFGRANEPLQSIFYCSTERETAYFETSSIARFETKNDVEIYTTSRWIIQDDIQVATFPINELNKNRNLIAESLNKKFEESVSKLRGSGTDQYLQLIDLLSLEFARKHHKENDYLISCAFANYLYDKYFVNGETEGKMELDGIIYPSVQWTKKGMNLALKPYLINNKTLLLDQVVCQKMERTGEQHYTQTERIISKSIDYKNGKIIWK
ncbi:MAG: RES domain-containing protein [Bacteroidota bacterium]|nr:RES domain-containing protein [Bacteroidota bacterium]